MVIKFECSCGNTNPKKVKEYDGMLGYKALICTCCGRYEDHTGEHKPDKFSKQYIKS